MIKGLIIDGITYDVACGVKRTARVVSSDISGTMLDGSYFNDVIGTAFDYNITIAVPTGSEQDYADMYEKLTDGAYEHSFILPYNNTVAEIKGRVEKIDDTYFSAQGNINLWRAISFNIISNYIDKYAEEYYVN